MSYNITNWKTKQLERLTIPLASFFIHERKDWHPEMEVKNSENGEVELSICETVISGIVEDGNLLVENIDVSGEGSGTAWHWIVMPALRTSKGKLKARLVWEGGDTISKLKLLDGVLTDKNED